MRYSRQEVLEYIGKEGQQKLEDSSVSIVGIGALGSVSAELLARAGIGNLRLIDRDVVDITNLQRQSLYTEDDVDKPKAIQAKKHLQEINSDVVIESHVEDLNNSSIKDILKDTSLILDGTDNLSTRFLINDFTRQNKIPWIYAAAIKETGYVLPILPDRFCFACVFKEAHQLETCDTSGVLNTITHLIASIQVTEALRILLSKMSTPQLIKVNIWNQELQRFEVQKNPSCLPCKGTYEHLNKTEPEILKFCGSGTYQIKKDRFNLRSMKEKLSEIGKVQDFSACLKFENLTIFQDRVLIKAQSEEEAKSAYSKCIGD